MSDPRPTAEKDVRRALDRLFDQAFNTAGDEAGRERAIADYLTVKDALTPPALTQEARGGARDV